MSFFAATRSTSICPAASPCGVRICVSMLTSFTSKGMYCSASHWIESSSSSCDIRGSWTRFTLEAPLSTPTASLLFAMALLPPLPDAVRAAHAEDPVLVGGLQAQREDDLALGVHAARVAALDARQRERRDPRLASQLRLREELLLAQRADVVHRPVN